MEQQPLLIPGLEITVALVALVLLFVAAGLAVTETSLSLIAPYRVKELHAEGRRGSVALAKLVASPEQFSGYLNCVLFLLRATQIVASTAVAYLSFQWFSSIGIVVAIVAEIIVGYVIAEAVPRTYAVQHTDRAALWSAPFITGLTRIVPMRLLTRLLIWSANKLVPGNGLERGPFVYEQQMLALADTAAQEQVIEHEEHKLIRSVIDFSDTIAREVMVPRPDMVTLPADCTAQSAVDVVIESGFSRTPVHRPEDHEILGVLLTKDLLRAVRDGQGDATIADLTRPVTFVPETKKVADLMGEMRVEKFHLCIVVDEYGTVVGLVTLEDLIEELVGEIADEYDIDEQPPIEALGPSSWSIDARMPIDDLYSELDLQLPHGEWDTVGGLLMNAFGRVPNRGESTSVDDYLITVEQTSGRRVTRARIEVMDVIDLSEERTA